MNFKNAFFVVVVLVFIYGVLMSLLVNIVICTFKNPTLFINSYAVLMSLLVNMHFY